MRQVSFKSLILSIGISLALASGVSAQGMFGTKPVKLPAKIAFVRNMNLWLLDANGSTEKQLVAFDNVTGRLAWHPDGKRITFARKGDYSYSLPDAGGGKHPLFDLFLKHIDSSRVNAWFWVTHNHGSHTPEWSKDGKYVLYVHDLNANQVDAEKPDYQIEWRTFDAKEVHALTRKGAAPRESQGIQPTWSPDRSKVAFVYVDDMKPAGIVIEPGTGIVRSEDELGKAALALTNLMFPEWSPDGKWIACVNSEDSDNGIYLIDPLTLSKRRIFEKTATITPHRAPVSWSADSKWLTFSSSDGYIYLMDAEGKNVTKVSSGGNDYYPAFCPK
ncbi:MAG: PD40 domain-containing protein [candidate division Zixibacteria bacterium]|nr:PD40 domain-containing protein [candidate division Zixibacteria bacterium]